MVSTKYKKRLETGDRDRGTPKLWNSEITPKLLRNWGPWNSEITPKSFRNYSETGDRDRDRGASEITPKLLRNWGTVELRNYSEIEDRGTMELWLAKVIY